MWYRNSFTKDKDEPLFAFQTQNNKNTKDPLPYKTAKCTQRGEIVHALYYKLTIHYGFPKKVQNNIEYAAHINSMLRFHDYVTSFISL